MNDVKGIIISSKCEVDTQADFFLCLLAIGRAKGKRMGECNIEDKNWGTCTVFHIKQKWMVFS